MKNTLNKENIDNLFKTGKWISTINVSVIYKPSTSFKYMVSAPIKKYRRATDRNKIKRLLRKGIFDNKLNEKNIDIAFIYRNNIISDFSTIQSDIIKIYKQIK